ncbi:MAG: RNA recognition motif domain-containing protein [Patescibacteria group bacterium]
MAKKLFVAGLAYSVTEEQLADLFSEHGTVESVKLIIDHDNGRSKGFGFVEMGSEQEGSQVIDALNDQQYEGRALIVKEARPKGEGGAPGRGRWSDQKQNSFGGSRNNYNTNNKRDRSNRKTRSF